MMPAAVQAEIEALIQPSYDNILATLFLLKELYEEVDENSQTVKETLRIGVELLDALQGSSSLADSIPSPLALPLPLAIKAVSLAASKIVQQRTGISLASWSELMSSTLAQFEEYLANLKTIAELAKKKQAPEKEEDVTPTRLKEDLKLLEETNAKTQIWNQMTAKILKLSQLAESLIESGKSAAAPPKAEPLPPAPPAGVGGAFKQKIGSLGDKIGDSVSRFSSEHENLVEPVMAPLYHLREKASLLKGQIETLSSTIQQFDEMLDLEAAQIKARLGQISAIEVKVLSRRIAVAVAIPRLKRDLLQARAACTAYQSYLEKLAPAARQGQISKPAYEALSFEYQEHLKNADTRRLKLEREASAWKQASHPILDPGLDWLKQSQEIVNGRELVGELDSHQAREKRLKIKRELERFEKAIKILDELEQGKNSAQPASTSLPPGNPTP
ncbi:MAG: hypothetical protein MUE67_02915 [Anaerolineales bacterium]|nr:hypothetical protein [Anaerolineales bacterium]